MEKGNDPQVKKAVGKTRLAEIVKSVKKYSNIIKFLNKAYFLSSRSTNLANLVYLKQRFYSSFFFTYGCF